MFDNDYNKQVERRQRIKKTTLVTGIDIGNDFNAVAYMASSPFSVEIQERLLCCVRQPLPPLDLPSLFSVVSLATKHV